MKTKTVLEPDVSFPDPKREPSDEELRARMGAAFAPIGEVLDRLAGAGRIITGLWKYSARIGWYRIAMLKRRRIFYLVPQQKGFRVSLILGDRAIAILKSGPHAHTVERLLRTAKRYPEGIAFSFDQETFQPDLLVALLEAKIAR